VKYQGLDETCAERPCAARERQCFGERFEVESLVASGGQGMVFRARDLTDGRPVALKVLSRLSHAAAARFLREAEALATLAHPAIVRYLAHGTTMEGEPYLAIEWLDGETLADCLDRETLTPATTARLGSRVLGALAYAHGRGIVHRDIKPSNLFLPGGDIGQAKVLDFGIARRGLDDRQVTRPGTVLGTRNYMAPEQLAGDEVVEAQADIFSLGSVLFECVAGEPPCLGAREERGQRAREVWVAATLAGAAPEPLRGVLQRMLALEPGQRPGDAGKLSDELSAAAEALAAAEPVGGRARRNKTLAGGEQRLLAVVVAAGIGGEAGQGKEGEAAFHELLAHQFVREALFARPDGMWNGPISTIITDRAEGEVGALVYFGREGHPFPGTDDQPSD